MNKPYIICHMVTSLDGKVTGKFLYNSKCDKAHAVYYQLNRDFHAHGYACGRITMEGSFTGGWYPDLNVYGPLYDISDYLPEERSGFYAVAFDPHGRLGWRGTTIIDEDPGYDKAQIIEVLTRQVDPRYLRYLRSAEIPYIFAGESEIDVEVALAKLREHFGIEKLLLEGGSILDGAFQRAGVIDELSLVVAPVVAGAEGKPLFTDSALESYRLAEIRDCDGAVWMNYKK